MFEHPTLQALSALHDGEMAPVAAAALSDHLRECENCASEYQALSSAANAVRHLRSVRPPSNFATMVRERVDAEERGMVPVLRGQILGGRAQSGFLSALGFGTFATLALIGCVLFADYRYGEQAARQLTSAWIQSTLPEPVLLHEQMSSPRFRGGSVGSLPFAEVERGREGTVLTLASIDQHGMVQGMEVIYRSGDEEMLARALDAVRASGFEPAKLNDEAVSVNFLYLFTTTEVRPDGRRLSTGAPMGVRATA